MDNSDYARILKELELISRSLHAQEERLKKIEVSLAGYTSKRESLTANSMTSVASSPTPIAEVSEEPFFQEEYSSRSSGKRPWWVLFEFYNAHYALQFLGVILFFVGIFLSLSHAIKASLLSPSIGMYGSLAVAGILALIGRYLHHKAFTWAPMVAGGALILAYGALFVGYKDFALFSPLVACAGLTFISLASLYASYKYDSRLFALLGLCFEAYSSTLNYSSYSLIVPEFTYVFSVAVAAVFLSLLKRWYSVAGISYVYLWYMAFSFTAFSLSKLIVTALLFTVVPPLYALYKGRDGLFEAVITAVAALSLFVGRVLVNMNLVFGSLVQAMPVFLPVLTLPWHLQASILCVSMGTLFLIELLVLSKRSTQLFSLRATVYALVYMFFSGALISLVSSMYLWDKLPVHCFAWFCGLVWFWTRTHGWLKIGKWLEGYVLLSLVFIVNYKEAAGFNTSLGVFISVVSVGVLSLLSLASGYWGLSDKASDSPFNYKDSFYALSALSAVYLWMVAVHTEWLAPYAGILLALYGSAVIVAAHGAHRPITAMVGYGTVGLAYLYALHRYLFFFEGTIRSWGMAVHTSQFVILKEATVLLGGLIVIGTFLYLGMQYRKERGGNYLYAHMQPFIGGMTCFLFFLLVRLYLICGVHYYMLASEARNAFSSFINFLRTGSSALGRVYSTSAERNVLTAYYALTGLLLVTMGSVYKKSQVRLAGVVLLLVNAASLLSVLGLRSMGLIEELVITSIGAIVVGASLFYRRFSKK
ncbi:DUF2339 domain-containing protein [Candidatus Dependentiae bacterium]|nr:DUF2339 domain-containing protein [Candidatus Dependentiae bacterium]